MKNDWAGCLVELLRYFLPFFGVGIIIVAAVTKSVFQSVVLLVVGLICFFVGTALNFLSHRP